MRTSASAPLVSGEHSGSSDHGFITSPTLSTSRFPMRPAGWFSAYWFLVKPLSSIRYTAHVSPNNSCSAVYVTGGGAAETASIDFRLSRLFC